VKERLSKMGQTPLSLDERDISLTLSDGVNLSPAEINSLRRRAVSALLVGRCEVNSEYIPTFLPKNANKIRSAQFFCGEVFSRLLESGRTLSFFSIAFLPLDYLLNNPEIIKCEVCKVGAALPPVIHEGELSLVREKLEKLKAMSLENVLVGNIGHIPLAKEFGFSMTGDFRLNICNSLTRQVYEGLSVNSLILSPELTASRARDIGGGVTVMGRIPLMLTERCFIRENFGCESCNKAELVDRTGAHFAIRRESDHRNIIFNSTLTYIGDRQDELSENNITHTHFIFSIESAREAEELILAYKSKKKLDFPVRRLGVRDPSKNPPERKMNKNSQKPHKRFDKKNNYSSKRTRK
jgi:putative protease